MLEVRHLYAQHGDFRLEDISLAVPDGECLALMGPTGSGKTLLLESILGVKPPRRGTVLLDGHDVTRIPLEQRRFSYLPQHLGLFPHLSVRGNIEFGLRVRRVPEEIVETSVRRAAEMLKISHLLHREDVRSLSGGEKQRVALARALAIEARVLFLDEPFSALDASIRYHLLEEFDALRRGLRLTTVFITHDMNETLLVADQMAVIIDGRIRQVGRPEEVYERPKTVSVARLLRVENLLPVDEAVPSGGGQALQCRAAGLGFTISGGDPADLADGKRYLGVRARYVEVRAEPLSEPGDDGWREATVAETHGPPSARRYLLQAGTTPPLNVECERVDRGEPIAKGQRVRFRLPPEHVFLMEEDHPHAAREPKAVRRPRRLALVTPALVLASLLAVAGIAVPRALSGARRTPLRVSVAVILDRSFRTMEAAFERKYPGVDVQLDVEPTVTLSRLGALRTNDVLAVVDPFVVEQMFSREEAPWVAVFAATEMVLCYTPQSRYSDQIDAGNWPDILLRDDVRYAYSNPDLNPCGYFTLFCWRLAERHYGRPGLCEELVRRCPEERILHDPPTLLAALQTGLFDYTFVPKPHCDDLGIPYVRLPREVSCGDPALADLYSTVQVKAPDYRGGSFLRPGSCAAIGITVLAGSPRRGPAEDFVAFVLSAEGEAILRTGNIEVIAPPLIPDWCRDLPPFLAPAAAGRTPASSPR